LSSNCAAAEQLPRRRSDATVREAGIGTTGRLYGLQSPLSRAAGAEERTSWATRRVEGARGDEGRRAGKRAGRAPPVDSWRERPVRCRLTAASFSIAFRAKALSGSKAADGGTYRHPARGSSKDTPADCPRQLGQTSSASMVEYVFSSRRDDRPLEQGSARMRHTAGVKPRPRGWSSSGAPPASEKHLDVTCADERELVTSVSDDRHRLTAATRWPG